MKKRLLQGIGYVLTVLCLGYFVVLMLTIGPAFRFNYIWLLMGIFFLGVSLILTFDKKGFQWLPKSILFLIECVVMVGCLLFIVVESVIVRESVKTPGTDADYLIVLGAKVNGTKPSLILQYRIEKASEYMKEHPECIAIVSGGKGEDEGISEAEAMKNGLVERGIEENRIRMEDQSTSTKENLEYSKDIIQDQGGDTDQSDILVVTTDFHVLRAVGIAKKTGFQHVEGLAAKSVWYLIPTNYVREFMAVIKDVIIGNM